MGLIEVNKSIPDIIIDLKYATTENFTKEILYTSNTCFLIEDAVNSLKLVQDNLRTLKTHNGISYPSGLGLKIWDGYRPKSIQYRMWKIVPDARYVANPVKGSIHSRGGAVDLTLIDFSTKKELEMPTSFDFFGIEAHQTFMNHPSNIIANRNLLKNTMTLIGNFIEYPPEWWHYNYPFADKLPLLDFKL